MAAAQSPFAVQQQQAGPVLVGQHDGRVLLHFDRPITWLGFTGPEAVSFALDILASAQATGAAFPNQNRLF